MSKSTLLFQAFLLMAMFTACVDSESSDSSIADTVSSNSDSLGDVTIGNQVWMASNLHTFYFRNGDPIPVVKTAEAWEEAGRNEQPACCYYENEAENGQKYGLLYNWYAVNDPRGLAPDGYHIPSEKEWTELSDFLGGEENAGYHMKANAGWRSYDGDTICTVCQNWSPQKKAGEKCTTCQDSRIIEKEISGNGSNSSGFSGLPGGYRNLNGTFNSIGKSGFWWSSTESLTSPARLRNLSYYGGDVSRVSYSKGEGFSVRCLRD
jgi:hypothetical protein